MPCTAARSSNPITRPRFRSIAPPSPVPRPLASTALHSRLPPPRPTGRGPAGRAEPGRGRAVSVSGWDRAGKPRHKPLSLGPILHQG